MSNPCADARRADVAARTHGSASTAVARVRRFVHADAAARRVAARANARASGARRGLKPLSIVVLDAGGQVRAFEREDGASNARFEIAFGKANGALALGMGSRSLMARAEQQPYFIGAVAGAIG